MLNRAILIGRLTKDPEMRYTSNGTPVTNFTLAIERPFENKDGKKETDFVDIVAWRKLAELSADYLIKGQKAAVEGRLQVRSYEVQSGENQGQKRTVTEVVAENIQFLEKPRGKGSQAKKEPAQPGPSEEERESDFDPDQVPF